MLHMVSLQRLEILQALSPLIAEWILQVPSSIKAIPRCAAICSRRASALIALGKNMEGIDVFNQGQDGIVDLKAHAED